jgi:hypothetical protein
VNRPSLSRAYGHVNFCSAFRLIIVLYSKDITS